jgi:hypothetical protein
MKHREARAVLRFPSGMSFQMLRIEMSVVGDSTKVSNPVAAGLPFPSSMNLYITTSVTRRLLSSFAS